MCKVKFLLDSKRPELQRRKPKRIYESKIFKIKIHEMNVLLANFETRFIIRDYRLYKKYIKILEFMVKNYKYNNKQIIDMYNEMICNI